MNSTAVLSFCCIAACIAFFAGSSSAAQLHRPDAYQSGQYYGDALHSKNPQQAQQTQ